MSKTIKRILLATLFCGMVSSAAPAYAWDSKAEVNVDDTHKVISVQALKMIRNDINDDKIIKNLDILEKNMSEYRRGAVSPDFGALGFDRDYYLYQDHFFDPDTGKNFTDTASWYLASRITDTAESQTRNYVSQAVAKWNEGNYSEATFLLGKASHYFADISEPHHASNTTGGPGTAHTGFEGFVEKIKDNYKITSVGSDKSEYTSFEKMNLTEFLTAQSYKYGKLSKAQVSNAMMSNSWDDWTKVADITLKNAQKGTASVVYRFLKEVTYGGQALKAPIGKFHVVVKTADETNSGTDDYVYFGMESSAGKKVEFKCDLAGNDFGTSTVGSYEFEINDKNFDPYKIKSSWIRKEKFLGDDWKPASIDVYMQGKRVIHKDVNQWLSGNITYDLGSLQTK